MNDEVKQLLYTLRSDARIYVYDDQWWIGLPAEDGTYWGVATIEHQEEPTEPLFKFVEALSVVSLPETPTKEN